MVTQHAGHGQHQVSCRGALRQFALQAEANHSRQAHTDRLTEHGGLGLNPTDAPAKHGESVNHRRMAVCADQRVGIVERCAVILLCLPNDLPQILQIDLVTNAGARRHDPEIIESLLTPAQKLIALKVALHLQFHVQVKGVVGTEVINHHRMVYDQIDRRKRVDLLRIAAAVCHGIAHRCQIHNRRHAGEILHQHTSRTEGDVRVLGAVTSLLDHCTNVVGGDTAPVFETQQIFDQHPNAEWQARQLTKRLSSFGEAVIAIRLTRRGQFIQCRETVQTAHLHVFTPYWYRFRHAYRAPDAAA